MSQSVQLRLTAMCILCCNVFRPALIASALMLTSCSRLSAAARLHVTGVTMGTYFAVTIDSPPETDTKSSVRTEITAKLTKINSQMSTWDSESEISRFNRSRSSDWLPVSAEFTTVVQEAKRIHELSGGAFDPTVSPLIDLWGFGKPQRTVLPDQGAIDAALSAIGMHHIEVRMAPPALRKNHVDVQLNLSAIAKGYAVDAIADLLIASGRCSFIVDIGGETRAGSVKASGDPWRVGIESPKSGFSENQQPARILPMTESSVATSGNYRNFFEADGIVYSHTINPATGRPLKQSPSSVSVVHKSCMTADALATAMMVLGYEQGVQLAENHDCSVLFQFTGAGGEIIQQGTGIFANTSDDVDQSSKSWVVFVASGVMFLVAVVGMGIGILVSNRQFRGSCGGLGSFGDSDDGSKCQSCSIPRENCGNEELRQRMRAEECGYDEPVGHSEVR